MSFSVKYEGVEIYDKVSVGRCWHDMHAWGALDELVISFGDTSSLWDGWNPKDDDIIEVSDGAARTGKMYVRSVRPHASAMDIRAFPIPHAMLENRCRSWESVRLLQLLAQIAQEAGMQYESYGIEDSVYSFVEQRNESNLAFLARRLTYEGASLIPFDGKLVAYSCKWAEEQTVLKSLAISTANDYEMDDNTTNSYESCLVTDGHIEATFSIGEGRQLKRIISDRLSNSEEAARFAQGLLREANRESATIIMRTDTMLRDIAAGSVLNINSDAVESWNGKAFVSKLRHDYYDSRSKIWLVRTLGGY